MLPPFVDPAAAPATPAGQAATIARGARRALLAAGLGLAIVLGLAACGGGEDRSKAQVRLVHASTGYAALDLVVDGQRLRRDVAYGGDRAYVEVDPDAADTQITPAGATTALVRTTPALAKRRHYALVAYGAAGSLRAVLLDEDADAPDRGQARVRVLNAAPEAGALDLYLTTAGAALADAGALHANAGAGTASALATTDAGTWRLRVTGAGDQDDLRLDLPAVTLADREVLTVVLTPGVGGVLVHALRLTQQGAIETLANTQARVRAVAGVTASGTLTATLGDVGLMNGSGAPAIGTYRLVPAGPVDATSGTLAVDGAALPLPAATLTAGGDHTLLVWGPATTPQAAWLSDDNRPATVAGRAKLRLVHGVAGLATPIALTVDFTPQADGVGPGTASAPASIMATTLATLTVSAPSLGAPLFSAADQTLAAGGVYSLFVLGAAAAPAGILYPDR